MTEKEVLQLEDKRFAAMVAEDFKALEAMVHDELLYTHSTSVVDTKASWLESMRSGKTRYRKTSFANRKVRVYGDMALVTGSADIEAEIDGQPKSLRLCFLNAWTKTPQGWKFVAWQSTPRPA
ncbi:MAG TPA: nuclear transport factor 2 family protein [Burkholderiales bacterium]|nr:nuclear transport factor 2 family protein [Burkholderiales bacterium]